MSAAAGEARVTGSELGCPVCDTPAPPEHGYDDVVLHRCPRCDHCFTDVDSLEFPGEYDEAWEALHPNWFANPNFALFEFVGQTIERHQENATVIDIGTGRGELLEYLHARDQGLSLTGLDVSLQPKLAGVEMICADITSVDLGDRRWDVAVSLATIEHVADVRAFASRLRSLVTPGGLAIVMTNNERSIPYDAARMLRRFGYDVPFERLYDRHHLNHFNPKSLRALMRRCGLRPMALHRHNIPLAAVDMPNESAALMAGVWATFALGRLTGRTFMQTLVLRRD